MPEFYFNHLHLTHNDRGYKTLSPNPKPLTIKNTLTPVFQNLRQASNPLTSLHLNLLQILQIPQPRHQRRFRALAMLKEFYQVLR